MRKQNSKIVIGLSLALLCTNVQARVCCPVMSPPCGNFYVGIFGGGGSSDHVNITQSGTAFFSESSGGPLVVNASGNSGTNSAFIAGLHAGYAWSEWCLNRGNVPLNVTPAAEIEGFYLGTTKVGTLFNPTDRLPGHSFRDTFPMYTQVYLVNTVWTFNTPCLSWIHPYVGGGIGGAYISIRGADSLQVVPPEAGVNHFNSNTSANTWTFAAQAKAGLKIPLTCHWQLFGEYRYVYLSPTTFNFGSTQYSFHAPTTQWKTRFSNLQYNLGVVGIEYSI